MLKPTILAVSSHVPWPLDRGGHIRTFHLLRALARDFDVRLVAGCPPEETTAISALAGAGIRVRPARIPRRNVFREAVRGGLAALQSEPYVLFHRHNRGEMWAALREELSAGMPDAAYLDHLDSWLFAGLFTDRPILADLHNIYSVLIGREAAASRHGLVRAYLRREARLLARVERLVAERATAVFAVSKEERDHYASLGARQAELVENGVDCDMYRDLPTGREHGSSLILYLGSMSWPPNVSAATFLATEALPKIRAHLPDARLRIVGREPGSTVLDLRRHPGVEVVGEVPDVRPHLREASVLAVPLSAGGGTRLKILEAFAAGLPVVSTPVGCEGLEVVGDQHLLIASREHFAECLRTILNDGTLGCHLAAQARFLARQRYDWAIVGAAATAAVRRYGFDSRRQG